MQRVIWKDKALESLRDIYDYISFKSPANAKKVIKEITAKAENLSFWVEKFQKEMTIETERNIRRAVIHSYKIVYEVTPEAVFILDIFHAAQNPDKLTKL